RSLSDLFEAGGDWRRASSRLAGDDRRPGWTSSRATFSVGWLTCAAICCCLRPLQAQRSRLRQVPPQEFLERWQLEQRRLDVDSDSLTGASSKADEPGGQEDVGERQILKPSS